MEWAETKLSRSNATAEVAGSGPLAQQLKQLLSSSDGVSDAVAVTLILPPDGRDSSTQHHADWLKQLQKQSQNPSPLVLIDMVDPTGPARSDVFFSGASGLAKTAMKEWGRPIAIVHLAGEPGEAVATLKDALGEISMGGEFLIRGSAVLTPELYAIPVTNVSGSAIGSEEVFLVTGGGRGVTADCAVRLAQSTKASFVLVGRSRLVDWPESVTPTDSLTELRRVLLNLARNEGRSFTPKNIDAEARGLLASAEVRRTLDRLQACGANCLYVQGDISEPKGAKDLVQKATERFGKVTGLIHGAGVLADKRIEDKTDEQVARVFAPKVKGLQHLLGELDLTELHTVALFSSVAARFGNVGQADYAMANEVLNRVARALKANDDRRTVVSFNWGPWDGGMVSPALAKHFKSQGVNLIPRKAGAQAFVDLLSLGAHAPTEVVVAA